MPNPAVMLYCPDRQCNSPNHPQQAVCEQCGTPLLRIYLRALGEGMNSYKVGELIGDRYLLYQQRILLDTKPAELPSMPEEIPAAIAPYLKLSPYQLHIPQAYGLLLPPEDNPHSEVWLLEQVPVYSRGKLAAGLMPELTSCWQNTSALQQLDWLLQIAQLWQPLSNEGVVASLLKPELLRVEGSLVRLLQLLPQRQNISNLKDLGQLWLTWLPGAHSAIGNFFQQLCQQIIAGQIRTSEHLGAILDQAIAEVGRSVASQIQIFTRSDTGPIRRRNEDSCYPTSPSKEQWAMAESVWHKHPITADAPSPDFLPLAMVCDGIGGHEGGDVASRMAIEVIQKQVQLLPNGFSQENSGDLLLQLETFASQANETISQQNDTEKRQDRQRMGTTLVMAIARAHELYITHIGDSRVYRITRTGCHQVTLDDDIASREVRLGYALYRDAIQQPASGSLVQALGMGSSALLHPTVQRFIVDEECIFLLCSDGLSDRDRVEQYWESELLPVLEGKVDLATAGDRLVEIGNQQNGHDNVTVALVHCQLQPSTPIPTIAMSPAEMAAIQPPARPEPEPSMVGSQMKTLPLLRPPVSSSSRPIWFISVLIALGVSVGLAYALIPRIQELLEKPSENLPSPVPSAPATPSMIPGTRLKINSPIQAWKRTNQPPNLLIPGQSILQVLPLSESSNSWLQLQVCSIPNLGEPANDNTKTNATGQGRSPTAPKQSLVRAGDKVYIRKTELAKVIDKTPPSANAPLEKCQAPT